MGKVILDIPPAEYKTEGFFTTILRKKATVLDHQSTQSGQKNKEKIVELMRVNSFITTVEIASIIEINRSAVMRHINALKMKEVLKGQVLIKAASGLF